MSQTRVTEIEEMAGFFDKRAEEYEDHMREHVYSDLEEFYRMVAVSIEATKEPIQVLDLGCGTGLELEYIFQKAPKSIVTCIDMSEKMLSVLKGNYTQRLAQLRIVRDSYLKMTLKHQYYDYVVSVMTMHHLVEEVKQDLYYRIRTTLKPQGLYIEGDYIAHDEDEEQKCLKEYYEKIDHVEQDEIYHLDIPFTLETQKRILLNAGFAEVEVTHHVDSAAILVARK